MAKKHQKHTKLTRPNLGKFGRNEFAILGTPCGEIKKLAHSISQQLSDKYKIAYVDADHKSADDASNLEGSSLNDGNHLEYIDKIDFHRFDEMGELNPFDYKRKFINQDLVLVNGNHFEGNKQVLVIDSKKSLEKKLHKLTDVVLVLFQDGEKEVPDYLQSHIPNFENIPKYRLSEVSSITSFIQKELDQNLPKVNGLVLAGGKSTRMYRDKSEINYFGKSQKDFMFDLLDSVADKAFYSVRQDQLDPEAETQIADSFIGLGPYGAILSAFRQNPNAAWLVTACDQPFLTKETLELLIAKRNPSKVATAFYNPETDFPEPLITLWEPRAYSHLLHFLSLGYSCPRKVLINTDVEIVHLKDPTVLKNVNTPEEYHEAIKILG
ncbi:Molybdopterin-guanine dinucleotide biosynthesis protein A [Reichenbachiella faecimaris]|uniref:Molybdopterin-guanine dinucleotide biosynthesis protein A n=1 Tax=Reichenbachiella faecimaris TaxID=692418 RepID=A0A1W2G7N7_REIFA|nr:NTP transferase domain-containing protein [Reichenbachiella faecimaris]SMD32699.1 Molybdopterin-guanine dinucleotide biosynthesis protein A [Reichenbachiella faecimaris]